MANLTTQLIVELLDKVSAPARGVARSLAGITRSINDANGQRIGFGDRLDAAITRNNRARLTPLSTHLVGVSTLCENLGGCLRKTQGQVGREFGVGEPANTIGPKETRHRRMTD